ncbi:MAG TPA: glycosyltransferase family 4 protein [Xanthomonadaceae bacterium]|nr:glycosyltransferase family 4 protein [Xanthomonadaceae bacterium]
MRILFLGKRHPQQRDLIERPYGRFHYLPVALAASGHDVSVMLCSHRGLPTLENDAEGVHWNSRDVRTLGPTRLLRELAQQAHSFHPDWIVGMSDAQYGWLAHRLSRRCGARLAIDAYDNYEAYMPWNAPLHWVWRRALRAADLVTAAGPQLAELLQSHRQRGRAVEVLSMAADPEFRPRDKHACRAALGLPEHSPLLGYVGSWTSSRGTHLLVDAFQRVRATRPEARLVLSGRPPEDVLHLPSVIGLGYLPDAQLPLLVSALDVAWIVTADTAFGKFSYPAKLYEAMACKVSVVASATDAVRWMLDDRTEHLARLGDPGDFAERSLALLASPATDYGDRPSWNAIGARLNAMLG